MPQGRFSTFPTSIAATTVITISTRSSTTTFSVAHARTSLAPDRRSGRAGDVARSAFMACRSLSRILQNGSIASGATTLRCILFCASPAAVNTYMENSSIGVRLIAAVLCEDCATITNGRNNRCELCSSKAILPLAPILNRDFPPPSKPQHIMLQAGAA